MGFGFVNGRGVGYIKLRLRESDKEINGSIVGMDGEIYENVDRDGILVV